MDRQGGRVVLAYAVGLLFGLIVMFDKVGPWLASGIEEDWPRVSRWVASGERLHDAVGLGRVLRDFDCSLSGIFDPAYKNTYRCSEAMLAEALGAAPEPVSEDVVASREEVSPPPEEAEAVPDEPAASPDARASESPEPAALVVRGPGNVLVVGDSLAIALAGPLERACKGYEGLTVVAQGKVASGLQNPRYYDWEASLRQLLADSSPVLVVVMMGANDAKYLTLDPEAPEPTALDDRRAGIYKRRLDTFLRLLSAKAVPACWVGLPVMGDPELSDKSRALNALARQACLERPNVRYLDTWPLLADSEGRYVHYLVNPKGQRVRVREGDKIHFSAAGGEVIVRRLFTDSGLIRGLKHKDDRNVAEEGSRQPRSPAL
ncbi:hypothetical protein JCM15519_09490 [Fundidesulfovibrio butyratiphilus]